MKRLSLKLLLLVLPLCLMAQRKERRVYYLDCSYSMVKPNAIWNDVRNNLIKAIENINDETTEIYVIPFSDDTHDHAPRVALATREGKDSLKEEIAALEAHKNCYTYHYMPLEDFERHRIADGRLTYMFLMTDGLDEDTQKRFDREIEHWGERYGSRDVYGFYVVLHKAGKDTARAATIDKQKHLWWVETADVNIKLIDVENKAVFNAKNQKSIDLKVNGDVSGVVLDAIIDGSNTYSVRKTEMGPEYLRVYIDSTNPKPEKVRMRISKKGGGKFSFLVTDIVDLTCEYKPERSLEISIIR